MTEMDSSKRRTTYFDAESVKKMKLQQELPQLLDFSDCVLTLILSYLNSYDLFCLSKTCTRFKYLIEERKLWRKVDIKNHPMCAKKFTFFFDNFNNTTDTILISGINRKEKTLTFQQFKKLLNLCNSLSVLAIENQYINSDEIRLSDFPESLKELSLRGTHITGKQLFLQDAHKKLANLHTLLLDDCKWFHEHSLMALSKLPNLENLSLYNCRNLNDSVAYMSVTARFGFQKLLRIDARCTSIGDQFLKCFHCIKTLREIYLESPPTKNPKRGNLFEEIKKWCTTKMQHVPNVVIFNQNTVGNVFKRSRFMKKLKKPRSEDLSAKIPLQVEPAFNCLEDCENCSVETCSCLLNVQESDNTDIYSDLPNIIDGSSSSDYRKPEVLYVDDVSDSEEEMMDFEMFQSDVTDSGVQWFCSSDPHGLDELGNDTLLFKKPYGLCVCEKKKEEEEDINMPGPSGLNKPGPSKMSPPDYKQAPKPSDHSSDSKRRIVFKRKKYCDNSDSENHNFPRPKRRCSNNHAITVDLNLGEGPVHLEIINEVKENNGRVENQNNLGEREAGNVRENESNVKASSSNGSKEVNDRPSTSNATNRAEQKTERPRVNIIEQPRDPDDGRNRDLRVIIERLDPGLHIVIDRAGRIQFGPMRANNYTKLKVFMARGYKMITDQALRSLIDLRLELLDVTGTSVTAQGIQQFLMVNPDCRVIHESICNCG